MSNGINKTILVGNLGGNPELKQTPNGTAVCNFQVATSRSFVTNGERREQTEWHRIVVWGKLAEHCNEYLSKGRQVYVEGRLQTRSFDDKEGIKRFTTEVVAESVTFLGGNVQKTDSNSTSSPNLEEDVASVGLDNEMPF